MKKGMMITNLPNFTITLTHINKEDKEINKSIKN